MIRRVIAPCLFALDALAPWRFGGSPPMSRARSALFHRTMRAVDAAYPSLPVALREALIDRVMGRAAGEWVRTYDGTRPLPALFHETDALLRDLPAARVVEIGCGSGRHLAWLAARHPRHRFVGADRFPAVVAFAHRYATVNLGFETRHALAVPSMKPRVVLAVGALTYVQPEHLARLLDALSHPCDLLITDPHGAPFRGNFSWTHAYRLDGWTVRRHEVVDGERHVHARR